MIISKSGKGVILGRISKWCISNCVLEEDEVRCCFISNKSNRGIGVIKINYECRCVLVEQWSRGICVAMYGRVWSTGRHLRENAWCSFVADQRKDLMPTNQECPAQQSNKMQIQSPGRERTASDIRYRSQLTEKSRARASGQYYRSQQLLRMKLRSNIISVSSEYCLLQQCAYERSIECGCHCSDSRLQGDVKKQQ